MRRDASRHGDARDTRTNVRIDESGMDLEEEPWIEGVGMEIPNWENMEGGFHRSWISAATATLIRRPRGVTNGYSIVERLVGRERIWWIRG